MQKIGTNPVCELKRLISVDKVLMQLSFGHSFFFSLRQSGGGDEKNLKRDPHHSDTGRGVAIES